MKLYDAIYVRKSIRNFQMTPLEDVQIKKIDQFIQNVQPLFEDLLYQINIVTLPREVKGYFVSKAPYYLVFSGERNEDSYRNAGYILEQIVLYLTVKGIGSCYQGCAKIPDELLTLQKSMEPLMIVAFGKPKNEWRKMSSEQKRLSVNELTKWKTEPTDSLNFILKAASLAPSSFNSQPWRFVVEGKEIHIFQKRNLSFLSSMQKMNAVDLGICMEHMMVAAEELWIDAVMEKSLSFPEKVLKNCQYVATMKMEKN